MGRKIAIWLVGIILAMLAGLGIHFAQEAQVPTNASWRSSSGVLVAAVQEPAPPPSARVKKDVRIRVDSDDDEPYGAGKRFLFRQHFVPFRPRLGVQLEDLTAEKARELRHRVNTACWCGV